MKPMDAVVINLVWAVAAVFIAAILANADINIHIKRTHNINEVIFIDDQGPDPDDEDGDEVWLDAEEEEIDAEELDALSPALDERRKAAAA